jgi:phosphatidylserine/phosphatidylglycerophosphate/cardiolipin synthase-like enzyme
LHSKLLIIDGFLTMGGSSNFDSRSYSIAPSPRT